MENIKWTTKKPTKSGYYWIDWDNYYMHQQGPMIVGVRVDEQDITFELPGMDNYADYENIYSIFFDIHDAKIKAWSDKPIYPPKGATGDPIYPK